MDPVPDVPAPVKERKKSVNLEIEKKRKEIETKEEQMSKKNVLLQEIKKKD